MTDSTSKRKRITLIVKSQSLQRFTGQWLYFGQNYLNMLRWEHRLGKSSRISCSQMMRDVVASIRNPFIDWVARLGMPYGNSLSWWMTRLAGKSVMQTPIFLHLCYIEMMMRIAKNVRGELLVVCEDWFLLKALEKNLRLHGYLVRRPSHWLIYYLSDVIKEGFFFLFRWVRCLSKLIYSLGVSKISKRFIRYSPGDKSKIHVVLHTCVDDACLGEDGRFWDRYFTDLPAWLKAKKYQVTIIPWLYHMKKPLSVTYRWFHKSDERFLILEDYQRLVDYPKAIWTVIKSAFILRGPHQFRDYVVTSLIDRERLSNASAPDIIKFLLYEAAIGRWIKSGNRCDILIDMFENMPAERTLIWAFRMYSPMTRLVGYQHASICPDLMGYSIHPDELQSKIFPDYIVSNGRFTAGVLSSQGFPDDFVRVGPALRYGYLFQERLFFRERPQKKILVLFPLDLALATELFVQIFRLREFVERSSAEVFLKIHPMMDPEKLRKSAGISTLPEGWNWAYESVSGYLAEASIVVGLGTGAMLEAAAYGIPIICLGSELSLSFNPLESWSKQYKSCETVDSKQFEEKFVILLNGQEQDDEGSRKELSQSILEGFGRVDERHLAAFIS